MSTKKVVRKRNTHSVKYRKEGFRENYRDIKIFADELWKAQEETKKEWDKGTQEDKQKMMVEFIRAYHSDPKNPHHRKYTNLFFPDGKPDYREFEKTILKSPYASPNTYDKQSFTPKAIRGFFIKRRKNEIFESDAYHNANDDLRDKFRNRFFQLTPDVSDADLDKELRTIKRKMFKTGLTERTKTEIRRYAKVGSEADMLDKVKDNPNEFKGHLLARVGLKGKNGITATKAAEMWEQIYGAKPEPGFFDYTPEISKEHISMEKAKHVATAAEYKKNDKESINKQPLTKAVAAMIDEDPELSAMPIEKAILSLQGKKLHWREITARAGGNKSLSTGPIKKHADALGIEIIDMPGDRTYRKSSGKKSKTYGFGSSSSISTGRGRKASSAGWFGSSDVSITPTGEVRERKIKGKISKTFGKVKDKSWGKIHPSPKQRVRDFEKKYKDYLPKDQLEYDKILMEKSKGPVGWIQRRLKDRESKRFAVDPNYKAKKVQQWEIERGIQAAKIIKAKREAGAMTRAAKSPFYGAFYNFSKYSKWIALTALIVAILFIPMGMFYVLGWALAVAVVALFQFIIWVFMEIWLLLAQAVVSIIGLIGQVFIMVINWIGQGFAGLLGQEYKPFEHQLVQNMLMFERDASGNWVVYTYTDTVGLTEAEVAAGMGKRELLTWGALNLTPPSFLNLDLFKPVVFDTDTIIAKILPPISQFFKWMYGPIAERYTAWISDPLTPWYWPGVVIGVPAILIMVGIIILWRYMKRKYQTV
jgi:hypothetical protein